MQVYKYYHHPYLEDGTGRRSITEDELTKLVRRYGGPASTLAKFLTSDHPDGGLIGLSMELTGDVATIDPDTGDAMQSEEINSGCLGLTWLVCRRAVDMLNK